MLATGCGAAVSPPAVPNVASPHPTVAAPVVVAAPAPLRRLTNEEYNNTVRDLLGDATRPADAFPPDEVVGGFENNTIAPVTQALVERYMGAAEALAATATSHVDKLAPCPAGEAREACAGAFLDVFGRLAFRRPLDEGERRTLLGIYIDKEKRSGHARAIQLVLESMLQSPSFLYRVEPIEEGVSRTRALTGYEIATRLSYFIWASTPDAELLDAAAAGRLASASDVGTAARRLLRDRRAVDGIRSFHRQWLGLRELETESKDAAIYPSFTPELKAAMVEETLRFSAHAVLEGGDVVSSLLTSKRSFVSAPLAKLYGVPAPAGEGALVDLPPLERSGLLTHASVMTVLAKAEQTSPIFRGKFVREKLLCQPIPPPPPSAVIAAPKADPKRTKKEQFAGHRTNPGCAACHQQMDPIGFGFEHYDALGTWRAVDGAFPVDAVGVLSGTDDADGPFDGAVALGARLSASKQVRRCIATQWFRAALGRTERAEDAASLEQAYQAFSSSGFDVRDLIVAITTGDAFRHAGFDAGAP